MWTISVIFDTFQMCFLSNTSINFMFINYEKYSSAGWQLQTDNLPREFNRLQQQITTTMTSLEQQQLSYRKQITRQLHIQYVKGIYDKSVTLKSRLRVTQGH